MQIKMFAFFLIVFLRNIERKYSSHQMKLNSHRRSDKKYIKIYKHMAFESAQNEQKKRII